MLKINEIYNNYFYTYCNLILANKTIYSKMKVLVNHILPLLHNIKMRACHFSSPERLKFAAHATHSYEARVSSGDFLKAIKSSVKHAENSIMISC